MLSKPGSRWKSAVCDTELVVVRAPADEVDLRCGGQPVIPLGDTGDDGLTIDPAHNGGTALGKRYADDAVGVEVLCTKAGDGSLSIGDTPLPQKDAKPLPASD